MSMLNKIRSFELDKNKNKVFGIKSAIIWGHNKDSNGCFPMLYLTKPKHVSQEDYNELLNKIDISIRK